MENPIKIVYQFNLQAGLLENGYDDFLESSMLIEEALEGFSLNCLELSAEEPLDLSRPGHVPLKEMARDIVVIAGTDIETGVLSKVSDVARLDKACDAVIIALGSIFKLGLTPAQATRALNIVMRHNFKKRSMPKDEFGKLTKPSDFIGPEEDLQKLLDER
jgi:hypothetical protein